MSAFHFSLLPSEPALMATTYVPSAFSKFTKWETRNVVNVEMLTATSLKTSLDAVLRSVETNCSNGCGYICGLAEIENHDHVCQQRPILCPYNCLEEICWTDFLLHLIQRRNMIALDHNSKFETRRKLEQDKFIARTLFLILKHGDPFFVIHAIHEFGASIYVQSLKTYKSSVTAQISVEGIIKNCSATFNLLVGNVRDPVRGCNKMILAAESIMAWSEPATPHQWKTGIEIDIGTEET